MRFLSLSQRISRTANNGVPGAVLDCDGLGLRFVATVTSRSGARIYVDQPVHLVEVDEDFRFRLVFGSGWPVYSAETVYSFGPPLVLATLASEEGPAIAWNSWINDRPFLILVAEWLVCLSRPSPASH